MRKSESSINCPDHIWELRALEILDTPPHSSYDRLTATAAHVFEVPVALIGFVDVDRVWYKSCHGIALSQVDLLPGFCPSAIESYNVYVVEDASTDPRTKAHPLVCGEFGLRFYAAAPIRLTNGVAIGTLSVLDYVPRKLEGKKLMVLKEMAEGVVDLLEAHRGNVALQKKDQELMVSTRAKRFTDQFSVNIPVQVSFWNKALVCEYASAAYVDWYGMESTGVIGCRLFEILGAEAFAHRLPYVNAVLAGKDQTFEAVLIRKDGSARRVLVQYFAHFDETQNVDGFFVSFSDITELIETKAALFDVESKFKSAFEKASIGMTLVEPRPGATFAKVNPALCQFLGYSEEELLTKTISDISHPDDVQENMDYLADLVAGKINDFSMEKRYLHKNGQILWGLLHVSLIRDGAGKPLYGNGQIVDITERKRLEEAFRQSQKMEVVGRLAGGVAHDFNNLLTAMMMSLEHFIAENAPAETSALQELVALGNRGAQLTRQLLEFARQQPMKMVKMELNSEVERMMILLRRLIGDSITVEFQAGAPEYWIESDSSMLDQVIMNLSLNARDAMPNGGNLQIKTDTLEIENHSSTWGERRPGRYICLSVKDTGNGIDENVLPRIFEPFFTTKPTGKGTGLGLASVFGNVQQHKGWVEVKSKMGQGSEFLVYLPSCSSPEVLPSPVVAQADPDPFIPRTTILLVEDHDILRRGSTRTLEQSHFTVFAAQDGEAALETWKQHSQDIDLLITDMMMPNGINGLQLARFLTQQKPSLKTILVSGFSEDILFHDLAETSSIVFLPKPFGPKELVNLVRETLISVRCRAT